MSKMELEGESKSNTCVPFICSVVVLEIYDVVDITSNDIPTKGRYP